ncbi:TfoX/Sxy family protein [Candidatus Cyrtobacter comes]|uniref:TfoX/Sxy family protein n=1 Tax=Candidatus Cyrtobacter comes TaxID=675776 RepID=A0ABU5L7M9_9RICK|nr:TfoX/Sxy family protein [Candidatus Cyrtobacter comes]MDZ5761814.1 TfoX/Sxy family protein [Candidatus Cyrtobacter comes]
MSQNGFIDYVIDILSPLYQVKARKLFGGYGLYINNKIFAITVKQELYFKYKHTISKFFPELNLEPLSYEKNGKTIQMSYWKVPAEILEDQESLGQLLKVLLEN